MSQKPATERTTLKRIPNRASYEPELIHSILDEALICHVAFPFRGSVSVLPTAFVRCGNEIFLHGSAASAMLRELASGAEVAVAITILDGLVMARSAFHHSMNYRSVVVFGKGRVVEGDERQEVLDRFMEKIAPGRSSEVRGPTEKELRATLIIGITLDEASAKTRSGPPIDDDEDYALPYWAGIVPIRSIVGMPEPDPRLDPSIETPDHINRVTTRREDAHGSPDANGV